MRTRSPNLEKIHPFQAHMQEELGRKWNIVLPLNATPNKLENTHYADYIELEISFKRILKTLYTLGKFENTFMIDSKFKKRNCDKNQTKLITE